MILAGMRFTQLLIWIKDSAIIGRLDYLPQHELIAYGWYKKHIFYGGKAKSILPFPRVRKNTIHPTMKPIPLLRELILNSTKRNDIVYDPFC
jgi:DNA modification methylase